MVQPQTIEIEATEVLELVGAENYTGPEGRWCRGLYQFVTPVQAATLMAMKNAAGEPLFSRPDLSR